MPELLYEAEVFALIGAAMEVYNELGPGFLEAVYQESLELELAARKIPFVSQAELPVFYKGQRLESTTLPTFWHSGKSSSKSRRSVTSPHKRNLNC